ncbi:MAG TPA: hypothetical protein VHU81_05955, partial [Thermoanaerobaculia bacterium]|nr:hypothetical protein [Thermoanaerobaculia bacterium]
MALTRFHLILLDGPGRGVFLRREPDGWRLPAFRSDGDWLAAEAEAVREWLRSTLGLEATVLRQLGAGDGEAGPEVYAEIEAHDPAWAPPPGAGFFGLDDGALADLPSGPRQAVEARLREAGGEEGGAPWERRGWLAEAVAWTDARLAEKGLARNGPVRQVKAAWAGSAVLAAPTPAGDFYFKATAGTPGEARILAELAPRWPGRLPELAAADPERVWMLTRDMAGEPLRADDRAGALLRFAEIQAGEAARAECFRALGCLDRGPAALAAAAGHLLVEIPALLAEAGVLSAEEAAELARFRGRVEAACRRLEELPIPASIHHEDFREGNVVLSAGRPLFFDWADTVIAHPFFSLQRFLDDVEPPAEGAPWEWRFAADDPRRALRDA